MYYTLKAVAGIGIAAILSGPAAGQGVVMQRNLSLGMAKAIAEATLGECRAKGFHTAAAVVDQDKTRLFQHGPFGILSERAP